MSGVVNVDAIVNSLTSVIDTVKGYKVDGEGEFKKIADAAIKLPIIVLWFVKITDNHGNKYLSLFYLDEENFYADTTNYYRFINNHDGTPAKLTDIHYKPDSENFYVQFTESPYGDKYFEVDKKAVLSDRPIDFNRDKPEDFLKEIWKAEDEDETSVDNDKITEQVVTALDAGDGMGEAIKKSLESLRKEKTFRVLKNYQIYVAPGTKLYDEVGKYKSHSGGAHLPRNVRQNIGSLTVPVKKEFLKRIRQAQIQPRTRNYRKKNWPNEKIQYIINFSGYDEHTLHGIEKIVEELSISTPPVAAEQLPQQIGVTDQVARSAVTGSSASSTGTEPSSAEEATDAESDGGPKSKPVKSPNPMEPSITKIKVEGKSPIYLINLNYSYNYGEPKPKHENIKNHLKGLYGQEIEMKNLIIVDEWDGGVERYNSEVEVYLVSGDGGCNSMKLKLNDKDYKNNIKVPGKTVPDGVILAAGATTEAIKTPSGLSLYNGQVYNYNTSDGKNKIYDICVSSDLDVDGQLKYITNLHREFGYGKIDEFPIAHVEPGQQRHHDFDVLMKTIADLKEVDISNFASGKDHAEIKALIQKIKEKIDNISIRIISEYNNLSNINNFLKLCQVLKEKKLIYFLNESQKEIIEKGERFSDSRRTLYLTIKGKDIQTIDRNDESNRQPSQLSKIEFITKDILSTLEEENLPFEMKNITITRESQDSDYGIYNIDMIMSSYWLWQDNYRDYTKTITGLEENIIKKQMDSWNKDFYIDLPRSSKEYSASYSFKLRAIGCQKKNDTKTAVATVLGAAVLGVASVVATWGAGPLLGAGYAAMGAVSGAAGTFAGIKLGDLPPWAATVFGSIGSKYTFLCDPRDSLEYASNTFKKLPDWKNIETKTTETGVVITERDTEPKNHLLIGLDPGNYQAEYYKIKADALIEFNKIVKNTEDLLSVDVSKFAPPETAPERQSRGVGGMVSVGGGKSESLTDEEKKKLINESLLLTNYNILNEYLPFKFIRDDGEYGGELKGSVIAIKDNLSDSVKGVVDEIIPLSEQQVIVTQAQNNESIEEQMEGRVKNRREMDRLKREMDRQNYYNRYGNVRGNPGYRGPSYTSPTRVIGQPSVRMATPAISPPIRQPVPGTPVTGQPGQPVPGQPVPGQPGQSVPGQPGQPGQPVSGQSEQDKKDEDDKEKSEQVDDDDKEEDEEDDEQEDVEEPPIIDDEMHKDIIVDLFKQKKDGVIDVSDKELEQLLIEQIKMTHKYELLKKQWFYLAKQNPGKLERENKENTDRIKYLEDKVFNILSQVISNNGRSSKSKSSLRRINSKLLGYVNEMRGEDSDISLVNTEKYVSILEAIDNEGDKKRNLSSKKKVTPRKNVKKTPKKKPTVKKPIRKRTRQRKRTPIKKKPDKKTPKNTPQKKNIQQRKKTPQKKKPIRLNKGKKSPNVVFKPRFEYDKEPVDLIKTPRKQNFNPVAMPSHNMITNNPPQQELDMLRPMM